MLKSEEIKDESEEIKSESKGKGNFLVCLKSGISFTLDNVELFTVNNFGKEYHYFKRNGKNIVFSPIRKDSKLDDVMDVIIKLN